MNWAKSQNHCYVHRPVEDLSQPNHLKQVSPIYQLPKHKQHANQWPYNKASIVCSRTAKTVREPIVLATIVVTYIFSRTGQSHISAVAFCALTISLMLHATYTQLVTAVDSSMDPLHKQVRSCTEHNDYCRMLDSRQSAWENLVTRLEVMFEN
ncbi:hypothetical protein HBI67_104170 [Parastagonospora nodorum]|nr:hypothetical protein HBI67_104170 [Parastagonospora nodorum]KAH6082792.1 hypothetical protein HBI66_056260 [Parastagonospora nodorum]KAH6395550.1 hypothetical protein HBI60_125510 [Parastagonospora nodorum]